MDYISVSEYASMHNISERTVRNWCAEGKMLEAFLTGKTWNIPADAEVPQRKNVRKTRVSPLLARLRDEKGSQYKGGIYHKTQIDFTFNSNHIEGSMLTHDQTRYIFETNTIGTSNRSLNVDDIVETLNHFRCIDFVIDNALENLSENLIKELHGILKTGTSDSTKSWFKVGDYKKLPNEVAGMETCAPDQVRPQIKNLIKEYRQKSSKTLDDILDFHQKFELIHPFQDGNGRVGRLIMFKECLANNIVPFIITNDIKFFYYRGLQNWPSIPGYLRDTCLSAQDKYKLILEYFKIKY